MLYLPLKESISIGTVFMHKKYYSYFIRDRNRMSMNSGHFCTRGARYPEKKDSSLRHANMMHAIQIIKRKKGSPRLSKMPGWRLSPPVVLSRLDPSTVSQCRAETRDWLWENDTKLYKRMDDRERIEKSRAKFVITFFVCVR